jgi:hypothetical protein
MRDGEPVEDFLLLLGTDTLVLEKEVQEGRLGGSVRLEVNRADVHYLGLLQAGVLARFKISEVRKDTFLKLFHVANGPAEGFEADSDIDQETKRKGEVEHTGILGHGQCLYRLYGRGHSRGHK